MFDPPIAVALDRPTGEDALQVADGLVDLIPCVKVGLELFVREGPWMVKRLREMGFEVFLDLKFFDIPNTIQAAVRSASALDVALLTVHGVAGPDGLRAARKGAAEGTGRRPAVVAVTVLTSQGDGEEEEDTARRVERLVREALLCGLDGCVCSPREAARMRAVAGDSFLIVTPGIRPAGAKRNDQRRVATPRDAVKAGSSLLVIGRPITAAPDPRAAARSIIDSL